MPLDEEPFRALQHTSPSVEGQRDAAQIVYQDIKLYSELKDKGTDNTCQLSSKNTVTWLNTGDRQHISLMQE